MDMSLLHPLNRLFAHHDGLEDMLVAYANASEILFLGMLIAAFVLVRGELAHRSAVRRAVAAGGLSAGLGLALAQVISRLADRPRPFIAHPDTVHLFAKHAADPGFPSDHATAAFAIAVALLLHSRRWGALALVAATILAITRVAMGIHYPTDVLAGAAVGGLSALTLNLPRCRAVVHHLADTFGTLLDGTIRIIETRVAPDRS
ncbi:phosphatase PAP2 family protein [Baekduia sp.]|jgi:undecaprenyl-diphosphatase|uniref:phosphatase PAP2 family protein n=1 Tax=Baekduia sp. TaxID=2600305 RepID=UPI002E0EAD8B